MARGVGGHNSETEGRHRQGNQSPSINQMSHTNSCLPYGHSMTIGLMGTRFWVPTALTIQARCVGPIRKPGQCAKSDKKVGATLDTAPGSSFLKGNIQKLP